MINKGSLSSLCERGQTPTASLGHIGRRAAGWCARPLGAGWYAVAILLIAYLAAPIMRNEGPWGWLLVPVTAAVPLTARRLSALGAPRRLAWLVIVPPFAPLVAAFLIVGARDISRGRLGATSMTTLGAIPVALLGVPVSLFYGFWIALIWPSVVAFCGTLAYGAMGHRNFRDGIWITLTIFGTLTLGCTLAFLEGATYLIVFGTFAAALSAAGTVAGHTVLRLRARRLGDQST